jgi:hypothetical protein
MRPLVIEPIDEGIEARLLPQDIGRGRLGRLLLQREMHPLVSSVLLRMARSNGAGYHRRAWRKGSDISNR